MDSAPHVIAQTDAALVQALLEKLGRDTLRKAPVEELSALSKTENGETDAEKFGVLRQRQQALIAQRKEAAVLDVLSRHDEHRRVTYRQDAWTKFKSEHTRSKDVPE